MKRIILFILVLFLSGCSIKDKDNVQTLEQEDKVEIKEEYKMEIRREYNLSYVAKDS